VLQYLNQRWADYTGQPAEQTRAGGPSEFVHPADRELERQKWRHALQTGETFEADLRQRGKDGRYRWFLSRGVPVRNSQGQIVSWFGTMTDIDAQRNVMTHQAVMGELDTVIRLMSDPNRIMHTLVSVIGGHLDVDRCLLTEVVSGQWSDGGIEKTGPEPSSFLEVQAMWESRRLERTMRLEEHAARIKMHFADDLRRGAAIVIDDTHADERIQEVVAVSDDAGIRALIIVPFLRSGRWVANLSVHSTRPRSWTSDERLIVEAAVKRVWPLVERSRAIAALAQSENRLRHAALAASFSSFDFDPASGHGFWSSDTLRVLGMPDRSDHPSSVEELLELVHSDDRQRVREALVEAADPAGQGEILIEFRTDRQSRPHDWFLMRGSVEFSGMGENRKATRSGLPSSMRPPTT
jgi:PAS domain S-box-containing protein